MITTLDAPRRGAKSILRRAAAAGAALLLLGTAACGDDDPTRPASAVAGTYALRTANGDPVPAVLFEDQLETFELLDGEIELRADGTFDFALDTRTTIADEPTEETEALTGTFTVRGRQLTFRADDVTLFATIDDDDDITMTFLQFFENGESVALVFSR